VRGQLRDCHAECSQHPGRAQSPSLRQQKAHLTRERSITNATFLSCKRFAFERELWSSAEWFVEVHYDAQNSS